MKEVYELILMQKVNVSVIEEEQIVGFNNKELRLGNIQLSGNSILGDSYQYFYPLYVIEIGPLHAEIGGTYLDGGNGIINVNKLNDFFLPIHFEVKIKLEFEKQKSVIGVQPANAGRLGCSMYI